MNVKLYDEGLPISWAFGSPQILLIASLGSNPDIMGHILDLHTLRPIRATLKMRQMLSESMQISTPLIVDVIGPPIL